MKATSILTLDGDVEVSQRKGKVITIYDFKLELEFEGENYTLILQNTLETFLTSDRQN